MSTNMPKLLSVVPQASPRPEAPEQAATDRGQGEAPPRPARRPAPRKPSSASASRSSRRRVPASARPATSATEESQTLEGLLAKPYMASLAVRLPLSLLDELETTLFPYTTLFRIGRASCRERV